MKQFKWLFAILATLPISQVAHAAVKCTAPPGESVPVNLFYDASRLPAFDPNVPVGGVLAKVTRFQMTPRSLVMLTCNTYLNSLTTEGTYPYLGNFLYQTPKEGVGMKLKHSAPVIQGYFPTSFSQPALYQVAWGGSVGGNSTMYLDIEFIKTGPITGRGSLNGEFARWKLYDFQGASYRFDGDVEVKSPTCKAATEGAQTVDLGTYPTKDFKGIGSVSKLVPFAINLTCSGGTENTQSKIFMTLTDNANPSNRSNTLSLAPDSAAKGLGIQVFKDSTLLGYGPDSSSAGNVNQWYAGTTGNGFFSIPLSARFIQTAQTLTSGAAKARMTFTISYQ
ncbi:type 1 fimbrial protein [Burkholderia anthina]|uniref:Type 1 fimbrial protein n=1 Tax=Burkholderia anthina TaxID=179879 RepID=A0A7T6VEM0_9BURK|nr:fimbrial protein [Burkholderia anthina]MBY4866310.1 type 1 fimbrial protein [Burkholderia anthina]QQK02530.1 type 1 fimbrial protein [Burkholderia anthina]